jgi:hypothetical protein
MAHRAGDVEGFLAGDSSEGCEGVSHSVHVKLAYASARRPVGDPAAQAARERHGFGRADRPGSARSISADSAPTGPCGLGEPIGKAARVDAAPGTYETAPLSEAMA